MSAVGTVVRAPGIVSIPCAAGVSILRGQLVSFTPGSPYGTAKIPAAAGDRIYGIATSDSDPDALNVAIAVKGGYTVAMAPSTGQTFQQGQLAYQDQTTFNTITTTVTASKILGWVVNSQPDAQGNLEVAFFTDLAT